MFSYLCRLFYLGDSYYGSQSQPHLHTIQGKLIEAAHLWSGEEHSTQSIQLSGRTDRGTHSIGQLVLIRTGKVLDIDALNKLLPEDIVVWATCRVNESFNPRFAVVMRHYRYYLETQSAKVDLARMKAAATAIVGTHDFSKLAKRDGDRSRTTTILNIDISQVENTLIVDVFGTSFLWNLVRRVITLLTAIGTGNIPVETAQQVLESGAVIGGGIRPAPAECLILVEAVIPLHLHASKYAIRKIRKTISSRLGILTRLSITMDAVGGLLSEQVMML
jgi:tRNA pseudouridine38-40 synthase